MLMDNGPILKVAIISGKFFFFFIYYLNKNLLTIYSNANGQWSNFKGVSGAILLNSNICKVWVITTARDMSYLPSLIKIDKANQKWTNFRNYRLFTINFRQRNFTRFLFHLI